MLKNKNKKNKRGFSLGEVIVSAFLISVAFVTIAKLMADAINASVQSRHNIIATQLAQEGVELVRNVRDNNWANGAGDFDYFPITDTSDATCKIDYNYIYPADITCGSPLDYNLYIDASNYYSHDSTGESTLYQRRIIIHEPNVDSRKITSLVIWGSSFPAEADCNLSNKCVYTQSTLTSWGG